MACDIPTGWVEMEGPPHDTSTVAISLGQLPLAINRPFDAEIMVCSRGSDVERLKIDAVMPLHNHGMNYYPEVIRMSDETFGVTGMFFHMPGNWRILVSAHKDDSSKRFTLDVEAK